MPWQLIVFGLIWERSETCVKELPYCPRCRRQLVYSQQSRDDCVSWECRLSCKIPAFKWEAEKEGRDINDVVAEAFNRLAGDGRDQQPITGRPDAGWEGTQKIDIIR